MDYNEIPVLRLCSFVWWNNHVFFSIIQQWLSSLLYCGLFQILTDSVCTCCFSSKQRHCICLTPMASYNPFFFICSGALGEAGCASGSRCLNLLPKLPGWTSNLTHASLIQVTSPLLSWPCAGVGGCALSRGALPSLQETHHLRSWLISPDPADPLPDGVDKAALSVSTEQKLCKAAFSWWQ